MPLGPSVPRRLPRSPRPVQPYLALLLSDLGQLQLHGRVTTASVEGDDDVRLQAWWNSGHRTVELLWCGREGAFPAQLESVRLIDDEREVWRSPGSTHSPAAIVRFLLDLLLLDDPALLRRYQRLG